VGEERLARTRRRDLDGDPGPGAAGPGQLAGRGSGPAPSRWEIGIALLPQARGKGHGTEAQRLLTRYLFAHTTIHRIEAITATGNIAEQKALERAGFTREGVLRGIGWHEGAWRDGVLYSILRTDP
jgi:RimJ/RimL family protein N-acetyltransferase